ncbi:23S rRNA (uracil(1939)-C(5))-methyltransferase RlmD [Allofranklinella schreckenbergeri]|uniref:23S rRNA (uracil(1939)-C(5))-methyltransferase RlmD n=1 Tax=Allofranklinella schreckenbergeri TaxID=1076744 RepID=A0A3M6Q072_9BURK|nr:23S rRNA (uracil(1939)-C(5))-methyltransferase RlmD [Allofranklinella schreckenbergeri]RMW96114.1 23S rRNA (uracil(1939)-C(5))-methyltransferase RlmD [Allofranklinella schreckenbergeri]
MSTPAIPPASEPQWPAHALHIDSLDMEAQGVAHRDGKVVFVEGALAGEVVTASTVRRKNNWEKATLDGVLRESSQRVRPHCPHFGLHQGACGGCKMQHLTPSAQLAVKQRVLEDNLWHLGKVRAERILRPIQGPDWGYRWRARLSVRYVPKKGVVLVGFHERKSRYIADMGTCPILPPAVDALLMPLRALIASLDARDTCPQIELACGDAVTALVLRHLEPLGEADLQRLRDFAARHPFIQWWLQPKGPDTVHLLDAQPPERGLAYALPEFGIRMPFRPTDFTQVNPHINRVLVARALQLLAVQRHERVIDWFCGLGNFSLPLATQAAQVLGIEGSDALVARAQANWQANQQTRASQGLRALAPAQFVARNLFNMTPELLQTDGVADRWLVDPPREGAFALAKALADIHQQRSGQAGQGGAAQAQAQAQAQGEEGTAAQAFDDNPAWQPPARIVYVSCNPATLARDAGLLVHQAGYRCSAAGVVNMFPHTAHVESIAVFDRV